jgi:hypothetical protein
MGSTILLTHLLEHDCVVAESSDMFWISREAPFVHVLRLIKLSVLDKKGSVCAQDLRVLGLQLESTQISFGFSGQLVACVLRHIAGDKNHPKDFLVYDL